MRNYGNSFRFFGKFLCSDFPEGDILLPALLIASVSKLLLMNLNLFRPASCEVGQG